VEGSVWHLRNLNKQDREAYAHSSEDILKLVHEVDEAGIINVYPKHIIVSYKLRGELVVGERGVAHEVGVVMAAKVHGYESAQQGDNTRNKNIHPAASAVRTRSRSREEVVAGKSWRCCTVCCQSSDQV
jgi:hypothetical protein